MVLVLGLVVLFQRISGLIWGGKGVLAAGGFEISGRGRWSLRLAA